MADNNALQPQEKKYKRHASKADIVPVAAGDMTAVLTMSIDAMKRSMPNIGKAGRKAVYPDTPEGLDAFKQKSVEFFEYVNDVNEGVDDNQTLIPDVETWAAYLGITRQTIFHYEQRSDEWHEAIGYVKNVITGIKKNLAMHYKVPPVVLMFDLTNNSGYLNSSEFHIKAEDTTAKKKELTLDDISAQMGIDMMEDADADTAAGSQHEYDADGFIKHDPNEMPL